MIEACRLRRDERYEACNDAASRPFERIAIGRKWLRYLSEQTVYTPKSRKTVNLVRAVSAVASVGASALCAEVSTGDPHP